MKKYALIALINVLIIVACVSTSPTPSPTPTPSPVTLPLNAPSDHLSFTIQQAYVHSSLDKDRVEINSENGAFLVLIGELKNTGSGVNCVTTRDWELSDVKSNQEFDYSYQAEPVVEGLYNLDAPGVVFATCLESNMTKRLFIVFDINPEADLSLIFRKEDGGQPVQLHSPLSIISAPTPFASKTPKQTNDITPTSDTDNYLLLSDVSDWLIFDSKKGALSDLMVYMGELKTYIFKIMGGDPNCLAMPSGQAYLVQYPEGNEEWKDRRSLEQYPLYVIDSPELYVNKNWTLLSCP